MFASNAQALVIGTAAANTGNCYPFGCSGGWTPTYQQVYGASAFSGAISISALSFYHTQYNNGSQTPNTGTYTFQLSTTSASVDGLSATAANNLGADNMTVFTGALPTNVPFGSRMDVILDSVFNYDPTLGNLLLSVSGSGLASGGSVIYFDMATSSTDQMSRLYSSSTATNALVTGFNEADAGNNRVSLPATMSLLVLGLVAAGVQRRKRKISV